MRRPVFWWPRRVGLEHRLTPFVVRMRWGSLAFERGGSVTWRRDMRPVVLLWPWHLRIRLRRWLEEK